MSVESALKRGRAVRQRLMRSRCRITRPGPARQFDPATGDYTDGSDLVMYEGPCHFKSWAGMGQRISNVAEREVVLSSYDVILPWTSGALEVDVSDTVTLTESQDEWVIGRPLPVVSVEFADDRTARHITVSDQDRGEVTYA